MKLWIILKVFLLSILLKDHESVFSLKNSYAVVWQHWNQSASSKLMWKWVYLLSINVDLIIFITLKLFLKNCDFYFLQEDSISDSRNFSPLRFKHNVTKMITLRIPFVTLNNTFRIIFNCMVVEFSNMLSMFNELLRRHCIYKGSFCKFTY